MYWRIRSFPELEHLTDDERDALLREHSGQRTVTTISLVARSIALGILLGVLMMPFLRLFLDVRGVMWITPIGTLLCMAMVYQFHLIRIRGQLIMYLEQASKRDRLPMCLKCGYNLRGITSERCPECGWSIPRNRS